MWKSCNIIVVLLSLSTWLEISSTTTDEHDLLDIGPIKYSGPYFDLSKPRNFTTQLGSTAYLPCTIRQLADKFVSWIRKNDSQILTVDRTLFITDERFLIHHALDSDTWTLQIKYVTDKDAGIYECQISTEPKKSLYIALKVVVPDVEILGGPAIHVNAGSGVSLKCKISKTLQQPAFVFWYKNGVRLSSDEIEEKIEKIDEKTMVSSVSFPKATLSSSGIYTCSPSTFQNVNVTVHVLQGEHPAAMYDRNAANELHTSINIINHIHGLIFTISTLLWW